MSAGDYCAAPFTDSSTRAYYRARIEKRWQTTLFRLDSVVVVVVVVVAAWGPSIELTLRNDGQTTWCRLELVVLLVVYYNFVIILLQRALLQMCLKPRHWPAFVCCALLQVCLKPRHWPAFVCCALLQVFFVDYGNTESMDVRELFDLPAPFLKYPFQVLYDIQYNIYCMLWIIYIMHYCNIVHVSHMSELIVDHYPGFFTVRW